MSHAVALPADSSPHTQSRPSLRLRLLLGVLLTLGVGVAAMAAAPAANAASGRLTDFDNRIFALVNDARSAAGVPEFQAATGLIDLSLYWSGQLAGNATNYALEHNPNAFQQTLSYGASNRTAWAENVAKWSPTSVTADEIFNAYMNSPGHRANILGSSYRYVGIASVTGDNGISWNTMTFTDKVDPGQAISYAPRGSVDSVTVSNGTVRVTGWAYDPAATGASIPAHVYVNGVGVAVSANLGRPDVNAAFSIGGSHGFDASVPATAGSNRVCVYGISVSGNGNSLISCTTVTWTPAQPTAGAFDSLTASGQSIQVQGWAYDPNSASTSIGVHVYVNGALAVVLPTTTARQDVNSAFGITGTHGYSATVPAAAGSNKVCLYGISSSGGANSLLGCRTVTVTPPPATTGSVDLVSRSGSTIRVAGWALDPASPSTSIQVHVYVNQSGIPIGTTGTRPDVNAAFGVTGNHGFDQTLDGPATGAVNVCLYAISVTGGSNTTLGCRVI